MTLFNKDHIKEISSIMRYKYKHNLDDDTVKRLLEINKEINQLRYNSKDRERNRSKRYTEEQKQLIKDNGFTLKRVYDCVTRYNLSFNDALQYCILAREKKILLKGL